MAEVIEHLADLTANRDRERVDVVFVQAVMSLLAARRVAVYQLVGEAGEWRWFLCARLEAGEVTPASDPHWVEFQTLSAQADAPWRSECLSQQTLVIGPQEPDGATLSVFPLSGEAESATVVEIVTGQPLTPVELRTIQTLLRIYGNFQGLLDYSQRDTLTGLLNRKTFDESFMRTALPPSASLSGGEADGRRPASASQYWLGVVDIDHFKRVNDNHGHLIGDEVLLLVARILRSTFRFQDRLYRFGGEEFVVMLRCAGEEAAQLAFERFRQHMGEFPFPQVGQVTASVGFTQVQAGDTPSAAFERADRAVYHAKQHGRDRVISHAELIRSGALEDAAKVGDVELF